MVRFSRPIIAAMVLLALLLAVGACSSPDEAATPTVTQPNFPSEEELASFAATAVASQSELVSGMEDSGKAIDPPRAIPDFSLTDQEGTTFGSANLAGKVALISFAYTHCPDVCPALFGQMVQLQRELGDRIGNDVELVIITVDPERDTVERLKQRTDEMGGKWHFLTGAQADVEAVWAGFSVQVLKQGDTVGHTGVTYLVTPSGGMTIRYPAFATADHFIKGIESTEAGS